MDQYRLPHAVAPFSDESLPGLITRNAEFYSFREAPLLLTPIDPPKLVLTSLCRLNPDEAFGQDLKVLLGLDDAVMRRLSLWHEDDTVVSILGQPVWRDLVNLSSRAVCPLCLQESPHHKSVWLLYPMRVCSHHGVALRDRCHHCARTLHWRGSHVHHCDSLACLADLRDAPFERVADEHLRGIRGLHNVLHADDPMAASPIGLPFGEALRLSLFLGKLAYGHERTFRSVSFIEQHEAQIPGFLSIGWDALSDWPHGFHRYMERLKEGAAHRSGKSGLRKAYGMLPNWVHEWAREPWGGAIGEAFANGVAATGDVATHQKRLSRYAPGKKIEANFVSAAELARNLGAGPAVTGRTLKRRGSFVTPLVGSGVPAMVPMAEAARLKQELGNSLSQRDAEKCMGVGRDIFMEMELDGLVSRRPPEDLVFETRPFSRSAIEAFVEACLRGAPVITKAEAAKAKLTPMTHATAGNRTVTVVCAALLDGRLKPAARVQGEAGLAQLRLHLDDLNRVLPVKRETQSMLEKSKEVGMDYWNLKIWAGRGFLPTTTEPGARGERVSAENWEQFMRDYISITEIGRMLGQPGNPNISKHLRFIGISAVSGRGVDKATASLFKRSDVTPVVIERIRAIQTGRVGDPQEKHRKAFERVVDVAKLVEGRWATTLKRTHNTFYDEHADRVVHVAAGRRAHQTGQMAFRIGHDAMSRLQMIGDPWVALVPDQGDEFLLMPLAQVPWDGRTELATFVRIKFDADGRPMALREWVVEM